MSYQNVGVPRFYIDYLSYWKSIGLIDYIVVPSEAIALGAGEGMYTDKLIGLDPTNKFEIDTSYLSEGSTIFEIVVVLNKMLKTEIFNAMDYPENKGYVGFLGHNFNQSLENPYPTFEIHIGWAGGLLTTDGVDDYEILNFVDEGFVYAPNVGSSLCKVTHWDAQTDFMEVYLKIRAFDSSEGTVHANLLEGLYLNNLCLGHYYDMPVSPDLSLTMTTEFDGYDSITTLGGSTLTNVRYTGNPKWGDNNAWEIGESDSNYKRNGRRSWSMEFSYISDKDIFASNYSSNTYLSASSTNTDYNTNNDLTSDGNSFEYNIANDDSFSARVLNFVGNGNRFIFQPNNESSNPSDFAICVLDQDSVEIEQVAPNVYSVSLSIREVW